MVRRETHEISYCARCSVRVDTGGAVVAGRRYCAPCVAASPIGKLVSTDAPVLRVHVAVRRPRRALAPVLGASLGLAAIAVTAWFLRPAGAASASPETITASVPDTPAPQLPAIEPPAPTRAWHELVDEAWLHQKGRDFTAAKRLYRQAMAVLPAAAPAGKYEAWWYYAP